MSVDGRSKRPEKDGLMSSVPDPDGRDALSRRLRTAQAVGAIVMASILVLLLIEELVRTRLAPFQGWAELGGRRMALRYGIYIGAAAVMVAIRLIQAVVLKKRPAAETSETRLRRVFAASVTVLVLTEVPAVLGFILFLLGGYNRDFYALLFVSLVLVFMYFPRPETWESHLRNASRTCPF